MRDIGGVTDSSEVGENWTLSERRNRNEIPKVDDGHLLVTGSASDPRSAVALTRLLVTVVVQGTTHVTVAVCKGLMSSVIGLTSCRVS